MTISVALARATARHAGLLLLAMAAVGLAGCEGDSLSQGEEGPTGPPGQPGDPNGPATKSVAEAEVITAQITSVTVPDDGRPVVKVLLTDETGQALARLPARNIRFTLAGGGTMYWASGRSAYLDQAALVGPTMAAFAFSVRAGTRVFGVGVLPYGWDALFGFSAEELMDQTADLPSVLGPEAGAALDAMRNASDDAEVIAIADRFFAAAINARAARVRRFPEPLETWLLKPDALGLDALVDLLDVSRRTTDRLAKYYFGASPKALQRKYRALHALTRLSLEQPSHWYDASGEGFYDQSHFIKEFKTFVGATPSEFMGEKAVLMSRSIRLRARATHKPPVR